MYIIIDKFPNTIHIPLYQVGNLLILLLCNILHHGNNGHHNQILLFHGLRIGEDLLYKEVGFQCHLNYQYNNLSCKFLQTLCQIILPCDLNCLCRLTQIPIIKQFNKFKCKCFQPISYPLICAMMCTCD